MKKILAVSLCAIMAVSAARADIASVEYVDEQITGASSAINTTINTLTQTVGTKAAQADLTSLQGTVTTLTGTVSTNKEAADKTQEDLDKLEETVAGLTTGDTAAVSNATFDEFKTANTQAIGTAKSEAIAAAKTETTSQIAALDSSAAAADGSVLTGVTITDGKITAKTEKALGTLASKSEVAKTDLAPVVQTSLGLADSALQKADITTGTSNGTIAVDGEDVAVKGLGTAAYTAADAYATSAQGDKADTAVQPSEISDMQTKTNMKNAITDDMDKENTYPTIALLEAQIDSSAQETGQAISDINAALSGKQATLTGTNVTSDGNGNVVTAVTAANGVVTVTKGTTLGSLATKSTVTSADITDGTVAKEDLATAVQTSLDKADAALPKSEFTSFQTTNTANIADAKKAGTDAAQDVVDLQATLTALATFPVACQNSETNCALLLKGGKLTWEKVTY